MESILDDPKLNSLDLSDQALYFRLLAVLNRQRSRDGSGFLDRFGACAVAKRERWAYAKPAFDRLDAGGLLRIRYRDGGVSYLSDKWPEIQGFAPAKLRRDSGETPALRGEEKRGEKSVRRPAAPAPPAKPSGKPKKRPKCYQADGWDLLSPEATELLRDVRPRGVLYSPEQVAAWFAAKASKMRVRGVRNLWRATVNWWANVTAEEVAEAQRWCAAENGRAYLVANPSDAAPRFTPEEIAESAARIPCKTVGATTPEDLARVEAMFSRKSGGA